MKRLADLTYVGRDEIFAMTPAELRRHVSRLARLPESNLEGFQATREEVQLIGTASEESFTWHFYAYVQPRRYAELSRRRREGRWRKFAARYLNNAARYRRLGLKKDARHEILHVRLRRQGAEDDRRCMCGDDQGGHRARGRAGDQAIQWRILGLSASGEPRNRQFRRQSTKEDER